MATTAALELILTLKGDAEKQFANLEGEIKQVSKAAKEAGAAVEQTGGLASKAGGLLRDAFAFATGGLLEKGFEGIAGAVVGGLQSIIGESSEAAEGQARLAAAIASTGGKAGVTADAANDLASNLQLVTKFTDDQVLASENMLLTFTNIGSSVFPQATEATLNMAQAFGGDATQAAVQLGKALNDPINGVSALQRVGVTFTQAQKDQIAAMMQAGDVAGAQTVILRELETEFGGAARAAGDTFPGQLAILSHRFDDLKQSLGDALMPSLQSLVTTLNSPQVQAGLEAAVQGLATGLQTILPIIGQVAATAFDLAGTLSGPLTFALQNLIPILATIAVLSLPAMISALGAVVTACGTASVAVTGFTATLVAGGGLTEALAVLAGGGGLLATLAGGIAALVTPLGLVVVAVGALALAWNNDFLGMRTTFEPFVQSVADGAVSLQASLGHTIREALGLSTEDWDKAMAANAARAAAGRADINTSLEGMRDDVDQSQAMINAATQAGGAAVVDTTIATWRAAQQTQYEQMHAMNDEAAILAMANADAVYDPHAVLVGRMGTIGDAASTEYMSKLAGGFATQMPAVNAYVQALAQAHDIQGLMAILGKNDAVAFITNMKMELAAGMEQVAAKMQDSMEGADNAATVALNARAAKLRASAISFGQQMGVLPQTLGQAEQEAAAKAAKAAKAAADAADRKAAAAAKAAAATTKHLAAEASAAETAARQVVGSQETIIRALQAAGQQTGPGANGIGQSLVTLMAVLKEKIPADMGFVKDAIVNTLAQANSTAPPTVQAMHDRIVRILQQLRQTGSAETKLFAQAALENIGDAMTTAADKAAVAADKLDATTLKAAQTAVQNLGKLGDVALDPKGNIADFLVQAMDAAKAAADGKMPQIAATITGWIDRINSDAPPKLDELYQAVVSQLTQLAQGSDVVMAAWAKQMLAHFDEVTTGLAEKAAQAATQAGEAVLAAQQKAAQAAGDAMAAAVTRQLEDQQRLRDAAAAQAAAAQQLPSALEPALLALQQHTKSTLDVLASLAPLATQAAAAGMPGLAAVINQYMDQARQGVAVDGQAMYQSLLGYLQQMAQSGDSILSTFAQNAIQHLQLAAQIQAAQQSLVPFQAAADAAAAHVAAMNTAVQDAQKQYSDLQGEVSAAKQAIQDFARAPLEGEGAFAQAMHANEQAVARVRLQMLDLQRAGVSSSDPRAQALQRQLDRLQQEADRARLQNDLTIGDQRFNLEQQANTTPEISYQDASQGIAAAKDRVAALTPQLQAAQDRLAGLTREQAAAQQASQAAAQALQAQQAAVQALTQQLQNGQPVAAQYAAAMAQTAQSTAQFAADTAAGLAPVAPAFDALFGTNGEQAGPDNILMKLFSHEKGGFFKTLDDRTNETMDSYAVTWSVKLQIVNERVSDGLAALKDTAVAGALAVGQALAQGIQQPIDDAVAGIAASAAAAVTAAIEAARAAAGNPHSPSPTMAAKVGQPLAQGVVVPMQQATAAASAAGAGLTNAAVSGAAMAGLPSGSVAAGGTTYIVNINGPSLGSQSFWNGFARQISIAVNQRPAYQLAQAKAAAT